MTMLGRNEGFAAEYRRTGVASQVLEADPHRLIALMLAGVIQRVELAEACLSRGDVPRKAKAISEATAIVDALAGCLDHGAGGEIAQGLDALYDYAARRLAESNANNDAAGLREVASLMNEIAGAWSAIGPGAPAAAPASA